VRTIFRPSRGPRRVASTTPVPAFLRGNAGFGLEHVPNSSRGRLLVTYVPYGGVSLTPAGRRLALRVTRRHRLLEAFLGRDL
jgi:hypothetical protein